MKRDSSFSIQSLLTGQPDPPKNRLKGRKSSTQNPIPSPIRQRRSKKQHLSSYQKRLKPTSCRMAPAPRNQYKMYLNDTENIFYENRFNAKILLIIQTIRPALMVIFAILLITFFIVHKVEGYKRVCPSNADCGVYIHCHPGFELNSAHECDVSEQTKNQSKAICQAVIKNLKLMYGNQQCENKDQSRPEKSLYEIYNEFQVANDALKREIKGWFQDPTNHHEFYYNSQRVGPLIKEYSLGCRFQLAINSTQFKIILCVIVVAGVVGGLILRHYMMKWRAKKIYEDLKNRIRGCEDLKIDKKDLRKRYGGMTEELWREIDYLRSKDRMIVYYEYEGEELHWRLLQ